MRCLGIVVWLAGCLEADLSPCGDLVCPTDTRCIPALSGCYATANIDACDGLAELEACDVGGAGGSCRSGVCVLPACGNGFVDGLEDCEGDDLGGGTCASIGFDTGTLACTRTCRYDTTQCAGICGDGVTQPDEACDTLTDSTCAELGFYGEGSVSCTQACTFDTGDCTGGRCGDGTVNGPELCDQSLPTRSCAVVGFDMGTTACSAICGVELSDCVTIGWSVDVTLPALTSLYVRSTDDVYAGTTTDIFHFDGSAWKVLYPAPAYIDLAGGPTGDLYALNLFSFDAYVSGVHKTYALPGMAALWAGSDGVYIVGGGGAAYVFNGSSVQLMTTGVTDTLRAIDGNASVIYAVGDNGTILRYDGSWKTMSSGVTSSLTGVWVGTDGDAWVVGTNNTILHLDNGTWAPYVPPVPSQWDSVWGDDAGNLYVGGQDGQARGTLLHFDGANWHTPVFEYSTPRRFDGDDDIIYAITDDNLLRSVSLAWAQLPPVTDPRLQASGAFIRSDGTLFTLDVGTSSAGRLDPAASAWILETTGTSYPFSLWGAASGTLYSAGVGPDGGWLGVYDGTWTEFVATGSPGFVDLWGVGDGDVIVAGNAGTVVHFDGQNFVSLPAVPGSPDLYAVWAVSATDLFVGGEGGVILRFKDGVWTDLMSGTTSIIRDLWGSSATDVHAVGDGGTLLHYDGTSWSKLPIQSPPLASLRSVSGSGPDDVFAAGTAVYHFDGATWSPVRMPGPRNIGAVYATRRKVLFTDDVGRVDLLLRD